MAEYRLGFAAYHEAHPEIGSAVDDESPYDADFTVQRADNALLVYSVGTGEIVGISRNGRARDYCVTDDGVRLRAAPGLEADVRGRLANGTVVHAIFDAAVERDGYHWRYVQVPVHGSEGWIAGELLTTRPPNDGTLTDEPDHLFSFEQLWPYIEAAGGEFGFDGEVLAGIMRQESGFRNWRVHADHTGHGLLGLDDNGMLPEFETWSGINVGRGDSAISIPVVPQIRYGAFALARYARKFGDPYAAARAWHRGERLMNDARGQNYEALIRGHVRALFS